MWVNSIYPYAPKKDTKSMRRYAEYENNRQWQDVFNRLMNIVLNIFEWENLPETCDEYFIEQTLVWRAKSCIIDDTELGGFLSLPCTVASAQNLYYEHSYYRAISINYSKMFMALTHYNKDLFEKMTVAGLQDTPLKGVVCFDNRTGYAMHETVAIYTDKIVDAMRSIDIVAKQMKISSIIEADEDTKFSIEQAIQSIDTNVHAVYVNNKVASKFRETKPIQTFITPSTLTELWNHLNNTISGFLTAFGINNLNTADKKERLVTDEVNSNNQSIELNLAYRHDQRLHFCKNYNAVFPGRNINCKVRHDLQENIINKGGKYGGILNDTTGGTGTT